MPDYSILKRFAEPLWRCRRLTVSGDRKGKKKKREKFRECVSRPKTIPNFHFERPDKFINASILL